MDRIDASEPQAAKVRESTKAPVTPIRRRSDSNVALWRPPGLAWAASFILAVGLGGVITTVYHSSQMSYTTRSDPPQPYVAPNVLHISFNHSVTIGEAEEALRSNGARVVEGPDSSGIIGVAPDALDKSAAERANQALRLLSERLRADPRVRWVEPVPGANTSVPPPRGP
jgi:hypothetical protein